jgi:hypothetical protein
MKRLKIHYYCNKKIKRIQEIVAQLEAFFGNRFAQERGGHGMTALPSNAIFAALIHL